MRRCEFAWDNVSLCDKPAVLIWKWANAPDEHLCAEHYDMHASLYLANAEEYDWCRDVCRYNGVLR